MYIISNVFYFIYFDFFGLKTRIWVQFGFAIIMLQCHIFYVWMCCRVDQGAHECIFDILHRHFIIQIFSHINLKMMCHYTWVFLSIWSRFYYTTVPITKKSKHFEWLHCSYLCCINVSAGHDVSFKIISFDCSRVP